MQYQSVLYNTKFRIPFSIGAGIVFKIIVDVIFGLMYSNFKVVKPISTYFGVVLSTILIVELFFLVVKKLDKTLDWNTNPKKRFLLQFLWQALIVLFFFSLVRWIIEYLTSDSYLIVVKNEVVILISTLVITMLFSVFELGMFFLYKWRFSLAEIERFKKENSDFRFEMLRNQVNPHFLFNSLNTLSSIMYENVDTAANYIRRLSEVYRYVLENRQKDLVSLKTELNFINAYKYLFELRFTDRLKFNIEVADTVKDKLIAPMTLQMLLENAVKHNVISVKKPLIVDIITEGNYIEVKNNFQPKQPEGYSSGMGLQNIKSQYAYLTGNEVEILNTDCEFIVRIPLIDSVKNG